MILYDQMCSISKLKGFLAVVIFFLFFFIFRFFFFIIQY